MSTLLVTLLTVGLTAQAPAEPTPEPRAPAGPERRAAGDDPATIPPPAPPAAPTEAERKTAAQKAYRLGQKLYMRNRYRKAITSLRGALEHWPYREIHFALALCYREVRDNVRGYRHLLHYLKGASPKERRAVPSALKQLRRKVAVVVVHSSDTGTEIWIGGRRAGTGRVEWVVKPGAVVVEVKRNGRMAKMRTLQVSAGGTATWDVSLGKIVTVKPRKPTPRRRLLHWRYIAGAGGVAVAATVAAMALGLKTRSLHDRFDQNPTWHTRDLGVRYQALTNVMWGLAGVAVVSTAVLAVFTRWRREKPAARIVPVVTPTGVAVTGTW